MKPKPIPVDQCAKCGHRPMDLEEFHPRPSVTYQIWTCPVCKTRKNVFVKRPK